MPVMVLMSYVCSFNVTIHIESRQQAYLFKLRQPPRAKRLLQREFSRRAQVWMPGKAGKAAEDTLQLVGCNTKPQDGCGGSTPCAPHTAHPTSPDNCRP